MRNPLTIGNESRARVHTSEHHTMIPMEWEVSESFMEFLAAGHVAYTNSKAKEGSEWHNDGSKLIHHAAHGGYAGAGCSMKCGLLIIISRITRLQTS